MHIDRAVRKTRSVPLTPLIDVVFLLLVFFMLSTSFVRTRSLELMLPQGEQVDTAVNEGKLLQIYVARDDSLYMGRKQVNKEQLVKNLRAMTDKFPDMGVLLLSGPRVSVQQMITVMDHIYLAGANNLSVASWEPENLSDAPSPPSAKQVEPFSPPKTVAEETTYGN